MLWRRKQEEDPFAALRGDGTVSLPGMDDPAPESRPQASRAPEGKLSGRIVTRRETGVSVAGVARVELTIEIRADGAAPAVVTHRAVPPTGSASQVGDEVVVDVSRSGEVVDVGFRPAIRPPGS